MEIMGVLSSSGRLHEMFDSLRELLGIFRRLRFSVDTPTVFCAAWANERAALRRSLHKLVNLVLNSHWR